jgi:hypothetical protein
MFSGLPNRDDTWLIGERGEAEEGWLALIKGR